MGTPISEYVVRRPPPALRDAVVHYCGYRLAGFDPGVHVGLPSPHLSLVIALDNPLSVRWPGGSGRLHAMVGGLHDHPVRIDHDGRQSGIELALTPLGCRALLGAPAAALARSVVPLDALLGARAGELMDRVASADTRQARFAVVDHILTSAIDGVPAVRPEVRAAWRHLVATRGRATVSAVADELGWSRYHLGAQFRNEVGLAQDHRQDGALRPRAAAAAWRWPSGARDGGRGRRLRRPVPHDPRVAAFVGAAPATWLASEQFPSVQDEGGHTRAS